MGGDGTGRPPPRFGGVRPAILCLALAAFAASAPCQTPADTGPADPPVQSPRDALVEDAGMYAARYGVPVADAIQRLRILQDSVAETGRLQDSYRARLAGFYVEHRPTLRFVMLLTGDERPADTAILVDGLAVPVVFRTGAPATREAVLAAIATHQADLRAALPHPPGLAADPRTGRLLVLQRDEDADDEAPDALAGRLAAIAGVPVELATPGGLSADLTWEGGTRLIGARTPEGRRGICSAGFVVTDGTRTGLTTAAHCPDDLSLVGHDGERTPLTMVGAWGAGTQDVQIHVGTAAMPPLFAADAAGAVLRPLVTWHPHGGTRVGDVVCHRGEHSGYSCAEVALVDFAPPGDLCAGPCPATWVAVHGPDCGHGDSGGPVFSGTVAFGLVKGASSDAAGACQLYFYMSTDYLPPGWTLLHE